MVTAALHRLVALVHVRLAAVPRVPRRAQARVAALARAAGATAQPLARPPVLAGRLAHGRVAAEGRVGGAARGGPARAARVRRAGRHPRPQHLPVGRLAHHPNAPAHLVAVAALLVGQHARPAVRLAHLLLARRRLPARADAPPRCVEPRRGGLAGLARCCRLDVNAVVLADLVALVVVAALQDRLLQVAAGLRLALEVHAAVLVAVVRQEVRGGRGHQHGAQHGQQ